MPVTCTIDPTFGIVHTTLRGPVSTDEIVAAIEGVMRHADFRPGMNGVVDLRETEYAAERSDVQRLADFLEQHRAEILPSRTAVVVADDFHFGMARMYQAYGEQAGIETRVLRDMDEALRWASKSDAPARR